MNLCTSTARTGQFVGAVFYVCLTAFSTPVFASEHGCSGQAEIGRGATSGDVSTRSSQVVSVDPDSGELVRSQMPQNAPPIQQRDTGPVKIEELPDGTVTADVGDRFRAHLVAEMVDGKLVTCHRDPAHNHITTDNSE
ncbi:MAG TPA: hypothetical protein VJ984_00860 [Xanthomonadales bacterium]|nr:hypothetical protein [Xanthomonadales bacterium]